MLSRLRKLLHPNKSQPTDQNPERHNPEHHNTATRMPFITGSQPWLKPYILAALSHPPQPPSLNAHYLQAISPVSSRRELSVYDGRFIIPAVLSQAAASMLDADEDDTGVTTRNLLGHVLAPVSVIVVPDMTTTPPIATLLIKDIRVFADRIHQRPVGRVPFVYTDPEVCDALRAIVGRQLASYATATVLDRADRATEIPGETTLETDNFFEKLLTDPSIPPSGILVDSQPFVTNTRRGLVVGAGDAPDDEHEPLALISDNPTQSEGDKSKDLQKSPAQGHPQSNQRDSEWEINFTQDQAQGGNGTGGDLPQTQHFAIDDDDDDDDDDDSGGSRDDENRKDNNADTPKDDDIEQPTPDRGKSIGERRIQEIVGNAQDDTLDGQDLSQTVKPGDPTTSQSPRPHGGTPRNQTSPVKPPRRTSTGSEENAAGMMLKGVKTPPRRKRHTEAHTGNDSPTKQMPQSPKTRQTSASQRIAIEGKANGEPQSGPLKPSPSSNLSPKGRPASDSTKKDMPVMGRSKETPSFIACVMDKMKSARDENTLHESKKGLGSPGRVTRTATRARAVRAAEKAEDFSQISSPKTSKTGVPSAEQTSKRRSPWAAEINTPPQGPRNLPNIPEKSGEEDGMTGSPETPLRRSPRRLAQKSPSQGIISQDRQSPLRRSPRMTRKGLTFDEEEGSEKEEGEGGSEYRDDEGEKEERAEEVSDYRDDELRDRAARGAKIAKGKPFVGDKQLHDPQSPLRRSSRLTGNVHSFEGESEEERGHQDDDAHFTSARRPNSDRENAHLGEKELLRAENDEEQGEGESEIQGKEVMNEKAPSHVKALTPERMRKGRGRKRKSPDVSSPAEVGGKKRQEMEQPENDSPEPFLDKIKAEIAEMRRFRDSIDRNPNAFKAYPDGFLPSAKPARESVRRVLQFPPPVRPLNQPLDVPESAPM